MNEKGPQIPANVLDEAATLRNVEDYRGFSASHLSENASVGTVVVASENGTLFAGVVESIQGNNVSVKDSSGKITVTNLADTYSISFQ